MRPLTNNPAIAALASQREELARVLGLRAQLGGEARRYGDGRGLARLAADGAALGGLDYLEGAPAEQAAARLRDALLDFTDALRAGYLAESDEVRDFFFRALAVGDLSSAHFLAALPESAWWPGHVLARFQALGGFALMRGEDRKAARLIDFLLGRTLETPLPEDLRDRRLEIENTARLLEALLGRRAPEFRRHLEDRLRFWPEAPAPGPEAIVDLRALGLCRLARQRGMAVDLRHVYLPIELLG